MMLCGCSGTPESDAPTQPVEPKLIAEPAPNPIEPESEPAAAPDTFTPATAGKGDCEVTVSALLEAEEFRGAGPMTPALAASLDADPDYARLYESESHGDHHIQCVFRVELAHLPGKPHRWRTFFSNTLREAEPEICKGMAAEIAEDILRTTKNCTDFAAGAYWGHVLEPMP